MPPAWLYVLKSKRNGRYYIGHTTNLAQRLAAHEKGQVASTRHLRPCVLVYSEEHPDPTSARRREWYLKSLKSRKVIQELVTSEANPHR